MTKKGVIDIKMVKVIPAPLKKKVELNTEARVKWLEALRSGEYWQTDGRLSRSDEISTCYCCWGVACELSGHSYHPDEGYPPLNVTDWLGLRSIEQEESIDSDSFVNMLISMNDGGYSFSEIADWIEANTIATDHAQDS